MLEPKYIIYHDEVNDIEDIIIFSGFQKHIEVAHHLHGKVVSAGFIKLTATDNPEGSSGPDVNIQCYGESNTLHIQSRPDEDTEIARHRLQL